MSDIPDSPTHMSDVIFPNLLVRHIIPRLLGQQCFSIDYRTTIYVGCRLALFTWYQASMWYLMGCTVRWLGDCMEASFRKPWQDPNEQITVIIAALLFQFIMKIVHQCRLEFYSLSFTNYCSVAPNPGNQDLQSKDYHDDREIGFDMRSWETDSHRR